jgi:hypothetical protein
MSEGGDLVEKQRKLINALKEYVKRPVGHPIARPELVYDERDVLNSKTASWTEIFVYIPKLMKGPIGVSVTLAMLGHAVYALLIKHIPMVDSFQIMIAHVLGWIGVIWMMCMFSYRND